MTAMYWPDPQNERCVNRILTKWEPELYYVWHALIYNSEPRAENYEKHKKYYK